MFSRFGQILDIICCKTYRLRGQAWIVFNDIPSATSALRTMQGFDYRQKPMVSSPYSITSKNMHIDSYIGSHEP